jgi:putative PIN family toxin of toxin-antitoxin system
MRAVLDTSLIVAALRSSRGASNAVLREVAVGTLTPLATAALFLEYEDVLKRSEQMMAHGLNYREVDGFLAALASATEPVEPRFRWRPQLDDPSDEMVLEAAVNGRADAIATHNIRDFTNAAGRFGVRVLLPRELLKELRS